MTKNSWIITEGSLSKLRVGFMPECLEKEHLLKIREMLKAEGFNPTEFRVKEYPITGVYVICDAENKRYFDMQETDGDLVPHYLEGYPDGTYSRPAKSIAEAMESYR